MRLATDLNTTQNTISRYETGEREPGIDELIKIADYFSVSVDYLICRTENPNLGMEEELHPEQEQYLCQADYPVTGNE